MCHEHDCMVLGLEDGHVALCPLPGASMGGVRVPVGKVPIWVLQQDMTVAHRSRLTALAGSGTAVATGPMRRLPHSLEMKDPYH